jgi:hypothetical protein
MISIIQNNTFISISKMELKYETANIVIEIRDYYYCVMFAYEKERPHEWGEFKVYRDHCFTYDPVFTYSGIPEFLEKNI